MQLKEKDLCLGMFVSDYWGFSYMPRWVHALKRQIKQWDIELVPSGYNFYWQVQWVMWHLLCTNDEQHFHVHKQGDFATRCMAHIANLEYSIKVSSLTTPNLHCRTLFQKQKGISRMSYSPSVRKPKQVIVRNQREGRISWIIKGDLCLLSISELFLTWGKH